MVKTGVMQVDNWITIFTRVLCRSHNNLQSNVDMTNRMVSFNCIPESQRQVNIDLLN